MSKGLGKIEESIIKFYEETHMATTKDVIRYLRTELNIKSHKSSIYRSMKSLKRDGYLIKSKSKNLFKGVVPNSQLPTIYTLDKNSEAYLQYKKKKNK